MIFPLIINFSGIGLSGKILNLAGKCLENIIISLAWNSVHTYSNVVYNYTRLYWYVGSYALQLSSGMLVPNSRDRHEKMAAI